MNNNSIEQYKKVKVILKDYMQRKADYIFIHYARQNFYNDVYIKGPRVITIVVMNAESEQTRLFSLRKSAERLDMSFFEVSEEMKNNIEYSMLKDFFEYVQVNQGKKWLHWNMKNNNFGFTALADRYRDLGGTPFEIDEQKTINISVMLKQKYGRNFAKDNSWNGLMMGKMYDIFKLNNITDTNILNGEQEIKEYILNNITGIEQSTLAKSKAFHTIIERTSDNVLKTRGSIVKDVYGINIKGIAQYIQDNAILAMLFGILGGVISTIICKLLGI